MSIGTGIVRAIPFQQVHAAPDAKARAQGNHQCLQYVYCAIEESHTSSLSTALRHSNFLEMKKAADRAAQGRNHFYCQVGARIQQPE